MRSRLFRRRLRRTHGPADHFPPGEHAPPGSREGLRRAEDDVVQRREGPEEGAHSGEPHGSDAPAEDAGASIGKSGPTIRYTFRRHWKRPQGNEE